MTTTRTGDVDSFSFSVDFKIHQEFQDFCCRQRDTLLIIKNHDAYEREKEIRNLIIENKSNYPNLAKQSEDYSNIIIKILDNQSKHKVVFDQHFLASGKHRKDALRLHTLPKMGWAKSLVRGMGLGKKIEQSLQEKNRLLVGAHSYKRHLTKRRLVVGPVTFIGKNKSGEIVTTERTLVTIPATNLLGSSERDLIDYTTDYKKDKKTSGLTLNNKAYGKVCEEQARMIIKAVADAGKTELIMPAFGLGVYINELSKDAKVDAQNIMLNAFSRELGAHNKQHMDSKVTITWVKYAEKGSKFYNTEYQELSKKVDPANKTIDFKILSHDLFDLILERPDAVILNAGSDATIGGAYTDEHAKTIEERISHRSALIIEHSIWNDELEKRLDNEFRGEMQHHLTENMRKLESAIESYNKNTTLTSDQIDLLNIAINYIGGDAHDELYFDENNKLAKTKDTTNLINSISTKIQLSNSNTDSFPNTIELLAAETQSKLLIKLIDNETGLKTSSVSQYEKKQSAKEKFLQEKEKLSNAKFDDTNMKDLLTLKDQLTQHLSQYATASQQAQERGLSDTAVAINRIFEKLHLPLVNLDIITKEKSSKVNERIYTTNQLTMFGKQENKAKSNKQEIDMTLKKKL